MKPFAYRAAPSVAAALAAAAEAGTALVAGGTSLLDAWKLGLASPRLLVDINGLDWRGIASDGAMLRLGALERMADVAAHAEVRRQCPAVAEALLESASPQVRNMASIGGNLLQRVRGGACGEAAAGRLCEQSRGDALFGTSPGHLTPHPSDLAVALVALDAQVRLERAGAARRLPVDELYRVPSELQPSPTVLEPGEVVTAIEIPLGAAARASTYVKVRDRSAYQFALVSVAVALEIVDDQVITAGVAAGGVGTRPWRLPAVEGALRGERPTEEAFENVAQLALAGARSHARNDFKRELLVGTLVKALLRAAQKA
jgi:xanthine dehydrogenase YagS FAD-binding subunit